MRSCMPTDRPSARALLAGVGLLTVLGAVLPAGPAAGATASGVGSGLLGATTAAVLPVTVVGEADVVPDAQRARLVRVGGTATRVAGPDRYATAVALARATYPTGAGRVVLATGATFPDAVVAGALAARVRGPLLLVPPTGLPSVVAAELRRLHPARLQVVGGVGAVPEPVVVAARAAAGGGSVTVSRLAGPDRYRTAVGVAATFPAPTGGVVLASGADFPDALAGTPLAAVLSGPVLLTPPDRLPVEVSGQLTRLRPARLVVAGGLAAVSAPAAAAAATAAGRPVERAAGADRYATAAALAQLMQRTTRVSGVFVTTGSDFPDATVASAAGGAAAAPLLLTSPTAARGAALAAEVGRLRGVGRWVQLTLDIVSRMRALPDPAHAAYLSAYAADTLARLYGWADPEVAVELARLRAARKAGGGYGLDITYDWALDGTVNPAGTRYLVTVTDHVGRALLDGYAAGAVGAAELRELVGLVLHWPRVRGDSACLAYSDSGFDNGLCVYNVSSGAAWFLRAASDAGIRVSGQLELAGLLAAHDAARYDGSGWWPYSSATSGRQDWNHNAAMVESHLLLTPPLGRAALDLGLAQGWSHPDPAARTFDDAMGYLRLLPYGCASRTGADSAARLVAAAQRVASDAAQLALWSARTAQACGPD